MNNFRQLQKEVKKQGYKGTVIGLTKEKLKEILNELTLDKSKGITTRELAEDLGVTPKTLRKKLRNLGIQKRPERSDNWHYGWSTEEVKEVRKKLTA